jgi:hypothetical protein
MGANAFIGNTLPSPLHQMSTAAILLSLATSYLLGFLIGYLFGLGDPKDD